MIENAELVMQMLEMYQMYKQQVPVELEEYLRYVAKTGNTLFQWTLVKPFIREKILNVIAEFAEQSALSDIPPYPNVDPFNYEAMKTMLLERFDTFNGPPFTIQRLCELLSCPRKEYNRVDKFMRAVEKNILVVSTCDYRSKREEAIVVNGVPDRWENGKESDINMDLIDKSNVISDTSVLNGNETVESLLNELESMKTPDTKLDEIKTETKDNIVVQVTDEVLSSNLTAEEPKQDIQALITQDTPVPLTQNADSTEIVEQINTIIEHESVVDPPKEQNTELSDIQPIEENNKIIESPIEELKDLSDEINLGNVEPKTEEPIIESDKLDNSEFIPTDADRVEGSIIHQTPDSDNKVEVEVAASQPESVSEKLNEIDESMDVQVEDVTKNIVSEVNCDNVLEDPTETKENETDKQENSESTSVVPAKETNIPTEMDVEPQQKIENDGTLQEIVSVNEKISEETKTIESNTNIEEPQEKDENKLTESK